jgi:hypothetical protein
MQKFKLFLKRCDIYINSDLIYKLMRTFTLNNVTLSINKPVVQHEHGEL